MDMSKLTLSKPSNNITTIREFFEFGGHSKVESSEFKELDKDGRQELADMVRDFLGVKNA